MCDSMIAGKSVTQCGFSIFGKNSDRSPNEPQPVIFVPAANHAPGTMVKTTRIEVEQVAYTYAVMLSKPFWFGAFSAKQVFAYNQQEQAMDA